MVSLNCCLPHGLVGGVYSPPGHEVKQDSEMKVTVKSKILRQCVKQRLSYRSWAEFLYFYHFLCHRLHVPQSIAMDVAASSVS